MANEEINNMHDVFKLADAYISVRLASDPIGIGSDHLLFKRLSTTACALEEMFGKDSMLISTPALTRCYNDMRSTWQRIIRLVSGNPTNSYPALKTITQLAPAIETPTNLDVLSVCRAHIPETVSDTQTRLRLTLWRLFSELSKYERSEVISRILVSEARVSKEDTETSLEKLRDLIKNSYSVPITGKMIVDLFKVKTLATDPVDSEFVYAVCYLNTAIPELFNDVKEETKI